MRKAIYTLSLLFIWNLSLAQVDEPRQGQLEADDELEHLKRQFLDKQYATVLDYYDFILSESRVPRIEIYKMASESCMSLSRINPSDSAFLLERSAEIYLNAVKWHGKMYVNEIWDSIKFELNGEPEVFQVIDQPAEFPGGMVAFYQYISRELKYPKDARKMGIEGRVYVQFVINKDGSIDAVNAIKKIGGGCDEEAVRAVQKAPNFIPGKQDGKPVYMRMVLPVIFKL